MSQSPMPYDILVVGSEVEAANIVATVHDLGGMLIGTSQTEVRVVDLRTSLEPSVPDARSAEAPVAEAANGE